MCGRYVNKYSAEDLETYYHQRLMDQYRGPNYNVSPTQYAPVVTSQGIEMMIWGLVPQWAESIKTGYSMINAVGETLMEKKTYSYSYQHQRCLVPASGFYEWHLNPGGVKAPYYIFLKERPLFSFAGLYVTRKDAEGKLMKSFTVITTKPNSLLAEIHNTKQRMPVILTHDEEKTWLDSAITDPLELQMLLDPYPDEEMDAYPVGKISGDSPDLIKPLQ